jgi:hypothetical protein
MNPNTSSSDTAGARSGPLDHDRHVRVRVKQGEELISPVGSCAEGAELLNDLLRGEMSAVEAYDLAIASIPRGDVARALRSLRDNHDHRVSLLRDRVRAYGVDPPPSSGAWGVVAKTLQRAADLLGPGVALILLEEGEKHGLRRYSAERVSYDMDTRDWVHATLLPAQKETERRCRGLTSQHG